MTLYFLSILDWQFFRYFKWFRASLRSLYVCYKWKVFSLFCQINYLKKNEMNIKPYKYLTYIS